MVMVMVMVMATCIRTGPLTNPLKVLKRCSGVSSGNESSDSRFVADSCRDWSGAVSANDIAELTAMSFACRAKSLACTAKSLACVCIHACGILQNAKYLFGSQGEIFIRANYLPNTAGESRNHLQKQGGVKDNAGRDCTWKCTKASDIQLLAWQYTHCWRAWEWRPHGYFPRF